MTRRSATLPSLLLALVLALPLAAGCGTDAPPDQESTTMTERPPMETMVERYEAMRADLFARLGERFGERSWTEVEGSLGTRRSACDQVDEGERYSLPDLTFDGTYDVAEQAAVRDLVEEVGRAHGFDDVSVVRDEPGDLDMFGEDDLGARYQFGMVRNTVFGLRTGCHAWRDVPPAAD